MISYKDCATIHAIRAPCRSLNYIRYWGYAINDHGFWRYLLQMLITFPPCIAFYLDEFQAGLLFYACGLDASIGRACLCNGKFLLVYPISTAGIMQHLAPLTSSPWLLSFPCQHPYTPLQPLQPLFQLYAYEAYTTTATHSMTSLHFSPCCLRSSATYCYRLLFCCWHENFDANVSHWGIQEAIATTIGNESGYVLLEHALKHF